MDPSIANEARERLSPESSSGGDGASPGSGRVEIGPGISLGADDVQFAFSSSSGPGGQNVNKRATKAELRVSVDRIPISVAARERLLVQAGRRAGPDRILVIVCDEHRSQERNKGGCIERLRDLVVAALPTPKVRKATKPSRGSKMRRLDAKRRESDIKRSRKRPDEG